MRTIVAILIVLFGAVEIVLGQNQTEVNRLMADLEHAASDEDRVDLYVELANEYVLDDSASTTRYAEKAMRLAEKIGYAKGAVDALNPIATMFMFKAHYEEADALFNDIILQAAKLGYPEGETTGYFGLSRLQGILQDNELAIKNARKSLAISESVGYNVGTARSLSELGYLTKQQDNYSIALEYYSKALEHWRELEDKEEIAINHRNIGGIFQQQGNYAKALQEYLVSLRYAEEIGDRRLSARSYISIGWLYQWREELDSSLDYYLKALEILEEMEARSELIAVYSGIGLIYYEQGQYELALEYEAKTLKLRKELKNNLRIARGHNRLAKIYDKLEDKKAALFHFQEALAILEKVDAKADEATVSINLGRMLAQRNQLYEGQDYLLRGLEIAQSIGFAAQVQDAAEQLAGVYSQLGDYKAALEYQVLFKQVADSLQNKEQVQRLTRLESEYEFEQEKRQLEAQKKRDELVLKTEIRKQRQFAVIGISGFTIVALLLSVIAWAYRGKARANQKLRQLDQFKTRLFANINHDFRTPITLIRGYVHRIEDRKDDYLSEESRKDLESLKSNASILTEMTNEIHNLLLLEEGKLELDFQSINLNAYLQREVRMFESLAELSNVDLRFMDQAAKALNVQIDASCFNKIIYNLMSNAFKFTADGGSIHVVLEESEGRAKISVKDTGKGIATEDLPHVFDRFYQSSLNEYRSKEGFGIGLAVVKELIDLHQGAISASSTEGKGTTFEIILPLTSEQPKVNKDEIFQKVETLPTKAAVETMVNTNGTGKHTVLVVDDHEEIRSYIVDLVSDVFLTKEAANGEQALKILEKDHIDLIITDLMMPHLDGFGFIEQLKTNDRLKNLPVMVVSARTTQEDRHRVLDAGVNEFISKPFDPVEFQKRTRNIIESQSHFNGWDQLIENGSTSTVLDKAMLEKLNQLILDHVSDPHLTIELIAFELSASRSKAIRMVKELTGHTPLNYIKIIRMDFVKEAIASGQAKTATEAAKLIGMKNPTQFANQYRKQFGVAAFESGTQPTR